MIAQWFVLWRGEGQSIVALWQLFDFLVNERSRDWERGNSQDRVSFDFCLFLSSLSTESRPASGNFHYRSHRISTSPPQNSIPQGRSTRIVANIVRARHTHHMQPALQPLPRLHLLPFHMQNQSKGVEDDHRSKRHE